MKTVHDKINEASEALMQWCDEDSEQELKIYNIKQGTNLNFDMDIDELSEFYLWLYDNGIRL
jgi:hypothetical protein